MVENIKSMTDDEVINIINNIITEEKDVELADLKVILAEASGRKLEKKYINIIAEKIKSKIQPAPVEYRRKTEVDVKTDFKEENEPKKSDKPTFDDVYMTDYEEDEDNEKYPALSFLSGLYAVFAWIFLVGFIAIAVVNAILLFKDNIYIICGLIFAGIICGLVSFISFYSKSEKIKIMIDIEKHLNIMESKCRK